jgi:uncharacterized protein (DUF488 family)
VRGAGDHLPAARRDRLIFTVGHSTRSLDELAELLGRACVRVLVDVRSVPRSRRHPQFAHASLAVSLPARGIAYRWERALGGFRRPRAGSVNGGWDHEGFRGYADYMGTAEFARALAGLEGVALSRRTCIMCAEAQWWRCHRRLIADALVVRGWEVLHLGLRAEPVAHELTSFAVLGPEFSLTYPPAQGELPV